MKKWGVFLTESQIYLLLPSSPSPSPSPSPSQSLLHLRLLKTGKRNEQFGAPCLLTCQLSNNFCVLGGKIRRQKDNGKIKNQTNLAIASVPYSVLTQQLPSFLTHLFFHCTLPIKKRPIVVKTCSRLQAVQVFFVFRPQVCY
jgi:hypothetical protein